MSRKKYTDLKQELVLSLGNAEITAANAASLSGKTVPDGERRNL